MQSSSRQVQTMYRSCLASDQSATVTDPANLADSSIRLVASLAPNATIVIFVTQGKRRNAPGKSVSYFERLSRDAALPQLVGHKAIRQLIAHLGGGDYCRREGVFNIGLRTDQRVASLLIKSWISHGLISFAAHL